MRLLINTSNIKKSGALQVTLSFLEELKKIEHNHYVVILSASVKNQINIESYDDNFIFYDNPLVTPLSRGFSLFKKKMYEIEEKEEVDCVFSVFGPTYWTPRSPHLAGFAYVWAINPDSLFIKRLDVITFLKQKLENRFKTLFFKKDSKFYVTETEDVKRRLSKYIGIEKANIHVVSNTYNHHFEKETSTTPSLKLPIKKEGEFRLVTISSNFSHKNLSIIKDVCKILKERKVDNVFFYVTIPQSDYNLLFGSDFNIINLGTVEASDCPSIYAQCDALFLPTLLECFTASYPEAMISKKPILTSDLDFAHSICQDAAIFFNPFDPKDIADKIMNLMADPQLYNQMVEKGLLRMKEFPSAEERALQYLDICKQITKKNAKNN